jgi:hypothetical protein
MSLKKNEHYIILNKLLDILYSLDSFQKNSNVPIIHWE